MMKDKIRTLIINDKECSVNYQKSEIVNQYEYIPEIDDLIEIFNDCPDNVFNCKTDGSITLVKYDDTEIPLNEYKPEDSILFIKISNEYLRKNDSEILILLKNKHPLCAKEMQWTRTLHNMFYFDATNPDVKLEKALADVNGYQNCLDIIANKFMSWNSDDNVAVDYCMRTDANHGNLKYQGYLPAMGQMVIIRKCTDIINFLIYRIIGKENINKLPAMCWTSTLANDKGYVWVESADGNHAASYKNLKNGVFPIFRKLGNKH